jgi:hypothetical protein
VTLSDLDRIIHSSPTPVILLEGRREIPPEFALRARDTGRFLAARFPRATFRSGNASGSDEAFSAGVAEVDPTRLHIVTPSPNHRMRARLAGAVFDSLTDLSEAQRLLLAEASIAATPANRGLIRAWLNRPTGPLSAKAAYLIRDTLKVLGLPGRIPPATAALFYVDPADPEAGGTGHTIRVCGIAGVPVGFQLHWGEWIHAP